MVRREYIRLRKEQGGSDGSGGNVLGRNAQVGSHAGKDVCVGLAGVARKIPSQVQSNSFNFSMEQEKHFMGCDISCETKYGIVHEVKNLRLQGGFAHSCLMITALYNVLRSQCCIIETPSRNHRVFR
jgi:hypothetical protein